MFRSQAYASESGALPFQAVPVTREYMRACARFDLARYLEALAPPREQPSIHDEKAVHQPTEEERRVALWRERSQRFLAAIRETTQMWEQEA